MTSVDRQGQGFRFVSDQEAREIVAKQLKQNASSRVLKEEDFQPNTPVLVQIPESDFWRQEAGEIQTEFRFLDGDLDPILIPDSPFAQIRFEISGKSMVDAPDNVKDIIRKGGRVFVTESDSWLIVHSEESLKGR